MTSLICHNDIRREDVRRNRRLNGLDYLEVAPDQVTLSVYFLGKAPVNLDKNNVLIEGGRRIRDIRIKGVTVHHFELVELDDYMAVTVDRLGDFSTYTLRMVEQNEQGEWQPHSAFDPRYDRVDFSFKVDCPSDLDCKPAAICPPEVKEEPEINYLAKDYASFRQLILDRLALVMPDWKERHVPDIGIALVELLAYVGDYLSYYQDAVATEAYLDTARRRISVRRHARLVDYPMHEGCNARAWVCVETDSDLTLNPEDMYFITGFNEALQVVGRVLSEDDLRQIPSSLYEIFEPISHQEIQLYRDHSKIHFYTWGDKECCLPRGTTHATLIGELVKDAEQEKPPCKPDKAPGSDVAPPGQSAPQQVVGRDDFVPKLHLKPGDVLVFEEMIGPETGHSGDADPKHRHAVRLTQIEAGIDPLNGQPVVEIVWSEEDALPFPLCLSSLGPTPKCEIIENISVAWGN
ncbi:MAG: putative baseplate assembly protein, partial [Thermodesulfobacteriota bacterium]|nr:putative baseplate assembly protein [Thermodesulfobacteriota bacterium]